MGAAVTRFLSAVLLVSRDVDALACFYRDALGLPLQGEQHGDTELHYGCQLGDVHFAIHSADAFPDVVPEPGGGVLALATFDLDGLMVRLAAFGVQPLYPPRDAGFARMSAFRDPDGRLVELTQPSKDWLNHIEDHRRDGGDILIAARQPAHALVSGGDGVKP